MASYLDKIEPCKLRTGGSLQVNRSMTIQRQGDAFSCFIYGLLACEVRPEGTKLRVTAYSGVLSPLRRNFVNAFLASLGADVKLSIASNVFRLMDKNGVAAIMPPVGTRDDYASCTVLANKC